MSQEQTHRARAEELHRIIGHILAENRMMLEVSRNIGFDLQFNKEAGEWLAEIDLNQESQ